MAGSVGDSFRAAGARWGNTDALPLQGLVDVRVRGLQKVGEAFERLVVHIRRVLKRHRRDLYRPRKPTDYLVLVKIVTLDRIDAGRLMQHLKRAHEHNGRQNEKKTSEAKKQAFEHYLEGCWKSWKSESVAR